MPAVRDEELAVIFREMRRASERSLDDLAERLNTPPGTLVALESGEIAALPEWFETSRVVAAYTALLHLDGRPVLRRLEKRFAAREFVDAGSPAAVSPSVERVVPPGAKSVALPPKAVKGPPMPPGAGARPAMPAPAATRADASGAAAPKQVGPRQAGGQAGFGPVGSGIAAKGAVAVPAPARSVPEPVAVKQRAEQPPPRAITAPLPPDHARETAGPARARPGRKGAIVTWVLLLAIFGVMALGVRHAIRHPVAIWATVDSLPEPAPQVVRSVWELVRPLGDASQPAPAADPQSQKTDRLPDAGAPQGN